MTLQLEKLVNKGLGRPLNEDELTAVKWWVSVLSSGKNEYYRDNLMKGMITIGNIKQICLDFAEHQHDDNWIKSVILSEQIKDEEFRRGLRGRYSRYK